MFICLVLDTISPSPLSLLTQVLFWGTTPPPLRRRLLHWPILRVPCVQTSSVSFTSFFYVVSGRAVESLNGKQLSLPIDTCITIKVSSVLSTFYPHSYGETQRKGCFKPIFCCGIRPIHAECVRVFPMVTLFLPAGQSFPGPDRVNFRTSRCFCWTILRKIVMSFPPLRLSQLKQFSYRTVSPNE